MRTFLITGASSGIGLALTHALAANGQRVIMAVRDPVRGERARSAVLGQHPQASLQLEPLDLTDLSSVRALAAKDLDIDVLVNNAGIGFEEKALTREGVLTQFAANHLGHFALTALLFEKLAKREDARVVVVTSSLAKKGRLDLDNLDGSRGFSRTRAYTQSKLANVLFAAELDRRLRARGSGVKSVLAHPGVPATAMQQKATGFIGVLVRTVASLFARPAADGALPVLEGATGATVQSGDLLGPGKPVGAPPRKEATWPTQHDLPGAQQLWERSEALAQLRFL
jgi:NAD(P)-dependent dehydrogenase (short-subunit alcohol dehydrogenase family)